MAVPKHHSGSTRQCEAVQEGHVHHEDAHGVNKTHSVLTAKVSRCDSRFRRAHYRPDAYESPVGSEGDKGREKDFGNE